MCQWLHYSAIMHPAKQQSFNASNQRGTERDKGEGDGPTKRQTVGLAASEAINLSSHLPIYIITVWFGLAQRCVVLSICQHPVRFTFRDWYILYKIRLRVHITLIYYVQFVSERLRYPIRYDTIVSELRPPATHTFCIRLVCAAQNGNAISKRTRWVCLLCLLDLSFSAIGW